MKHNNVFYMQVSREIFTDKYKDLSINAKWLFIVLNELEQRYTGKNEDFFFKSELDLANDCGFSMATLKRAKSELSKTDLVEIWQSHYINEETQQKSEKHFTYYRIRGK